MAHRVVFWMFEILCCGYALSRGGAAERCGAAIVLAGTLASIAAMPDAAPGFRRVAWGVFTVDLAMLCAFTALALASKRFWPLWMVAFQVLQLASHFTRMLPGTISLAYAIAMTVLAYPMVLLVATGTWRHRRRLRRYGADASWRVSSPRSSQFVTTRSPRG